MKGKQHPANDITINPSDNESIREVIDRISTSRRTFIKTSASASMLAAFGGLSMTGIVRAVSAAPLLATNGFAGMGFESIPPKLAPVADTVEVPPGYTVEVLASWGDPIMPGAPDWLEDASQDASAAAMQFGNHNDGMHYFGFPQRRGGASNARGLLCVNHEYTHEQILHGAEGLVDSAGNTTIEKVRKSQESHGISVNEVVLSRDGWQVNRHSPFGRRVTANTPARVSGPAAGSSLLKSKAYVITSTGSAEIGLNDGYTAYGTVNNCAHGYTPWGTYLTCEENWNGYFGGAPTDESDIEDGLPFDQKIVILASNNRYGITANGFGYLWHTVDPRFDASANPLEPHTFGYVVEVDPFDPNSPPVKRTAMGRFKHESAQVAVSEGNRVAYYMGDDERNEYVYKFVCAQPFDPRNRRANRDLLDTGTLYVARFTDEPGISASAFRGVWVPLEPDTDTVFDDPNDTNVPPRKLKLRELETFQSADDAEVQAKICVFTRKAADAVGATMMDRPEWVALRTYFDPLAAVTGFPYPTYGVERPLELYCTMTNNNRRGGGGTISSNNPDGSTGAGSARPPVDAANPRPDNDYGHIVRWREDGNVVTALGFEWDIFVLCGDSATSKTLAFTYDPTNLVGIGYEGNVVDTVGEGGNPDAASPGADFGAPDGLWFDHFGRLWIQTDQAGDALGDWVNIGANAMLCADPNTKEVRRFLTSPPNCEVTGVITTPDGRTMFCGIQHPGEDAPADDPTLYSNWPQAQFAANSAGVPLPNGPSSRPRSSVLVITKDDGGVIGS